jgi:hypothetical protein
VSTEEGRESYSLKMIAFLANHNFHTVYFEREVHTLVRNDSFSKDLGWYLFLNVSISMMEVGGEMSGARLPKDKDHTCEAKGKLKKMFSIVSS